MRTVARARASLSPHVPVPRFSDSEVLAPFSLRYGISVDARHLSLIADYMTCTGQYRPMNRAGMVGGSSPFLQMSFESTVRNARARARSISARRSSGARSPLTH